MADTLSEIFNSTTLGATQMDDGEETLITTDATTSYVVKDMNVQGTSSLTNTYLELNGFKVGNITSNATGSLVIPPNSTLKLKSTDYPHSFLKDEVLVLDDNYRPYYEASIRLSGSTSSTVVTEATTTNTFASSPLQALKVNYNVADDDVGRFYMEIHDNNSQQSVYELSPTGSQGTMMSGSYLAAGTGRMENGDFVGFTSSSNDFYKQDLDIDATVGLTSGGSFTSANPYPSSSYPRHFFGYDHIWYIPNSGYDGNYYALSLNTGTLRSYSGLSSVTTSGYTFFCVSHNTTTDKLYIWRVSDSNNVVVTDISASKTDFMADQAGSGGRSIVNAGTTVNFPVPLNMGFTAFARLSPTPDGGVMYRANDGTIRTIGINGVETADPISVNSLDIGGAARSVYYFDKSTSVVTAAEAAAAGVTAPTFGVQLLGIKSENV